MGAKGSQVQRITRDFDVNIKFPDKAGTGENGEATAHVDPERSTNPNIIRITGIHNRNNINCRVILS